MKTIGMVIPNRLDTTALYRSTGPFAELQRNLNNVRFVQPMEWDWGLMHQLDAVFMQRPYSPQHKDIFDLALTMGKPVWIDFDDDLLELFDVDRDLKKDRLRGVG